MRFNKPESLSYKDTVRFHGHDGPFLAVGYRLGKHVVRVMRPRGIMDLKITVEAKIMKPFTCLVDGLQCSTFATLGKGNLLVRGRSANDIVVRIEKGGIVIRYKMTRKAWDICLHADDLIGAARRIRRMPISELWAKQRK